MTEAPGLHRRAIDLRSGRQCTDEVGDGQPAEALDTPPDQLPEDGRGRLRIAERGVDRLDPDLQRLHQPGQPRRLPRRQFQHQPAQGGGVDHRVLEGSGQAAPEDPGVERVVAVLDQDGAAGEVKEGTARVAELGSAYQHLALDQVPPLGVGVDGRARVDEGVEEAQRTLEVEALGADLEDQEGPVAGGLDVHRDELRLRQRRVGADGQDLVAGRLPGDGLCSAAGL